MFFISWGRRGGVAELGDAGHRHCARCDKDSQFQALVGYTVRHLWWVFRWVSDRKYAVACSNCGAQYAAAESDFDKQRVAKAIPLWDRRGWLAGPAIIGSLNRRRHGGQCR